MLHMILVFGTNKADQDFSTWLCVTAKDLPTARRLARKYARTHLGAVGDVYTEKAVSTPGVPVEPLQADYWR